MVRKEIGAVASFKKAVVVNGYPKTRSGEVFRGTMRNLADGEQYTVPSTIDDPAILEGIEQALKEIGYGMRHSHSPRIV